MSKAKVRIIFIHNLLFFLSPSSHPKDPFCSVCHEKFPSFADFGVHLKSQTHAENMVAAGKAKASPAPRPASAERSSPSNSPATARRIPTIPCKMHSVQGKMCRFGWYCNFKHDDHSSPRTPEPNLFAIDVECVATGLGHNDRDVCSIAVVDGSLEVVLFVTVKPEKEIKSYLTPITGFNAGDLDDGIPLEEALEKLYSLLTPDSIIIGQAPQNDIRWTKLEKGKHYAEVVDIAQLFKTSNAKGQEYFLLALRLFHHDIVCMLTSPVFFIHCKELHSPFFK